MNTRRAAACLVVAALVVSGCSLGPREEWASAIRGAPEAAREHGSAHVRVLVDLVTVETNAFQQPRPLVPSMEGVVDFTNASARLVGPGDPAPVIFYDGLTAYLPRSEGSLVRQDAGTEAFSRFDFVRKPSRRIDDNDRRLAVGAGLISPAIAVRLLEGVLTGSVERVGAEERGGVAVTKYTARASVDSVGRSLEEEAHREGLNRLFETHGVGDDVFPLEIWIDDQGLPRGVKAVLRQQKDRVNHYDLHVDWDFYDFGAPADIPLPTREETIEATRFYDFVVEFIREVV